MYDLRMASPTTYQSPTARALDSISKQLAAMLDLDPENHEITYQETALTHTGHHATVYTCYTVRRVAHPDLILSIGVAKCHSWEGPERDQVTLYRRNG